MNTSDTSTVTMLTGDLRCHSAFKGSNATFITDIPTALGGRGEYPPPSAMLGATLASCMMSMLAYTGKRKGFPTDGISVQATCREDSTGICAFDLRISVPMNPPKNVRALMEAAVRSCPVGNALRPDIPKNISWVYAGDTLPD